MRMQKEKPTGRITGKTYGVYGIMEWVALIPAAGRVLRIHFKGGSMTGYGVVPATYSTENAVVQRLIEQSPHYASGKIRIVGIREE